MLSESSQTPHLRDSEEVPRLWYTWIDIVQVVRRRDAIAEVRRRAVVGLSTSHTFHTTLCTYVDYTVFQKNIPVFYQTLSDFNIFWQKYSSSILAWRSAFISHLAKNCVLTLPGDTKNVIMTYFLCYRPMSVFQFFNKRWVRVYFDFKSVTCLHTCLHF